MSIINNENIKKEIKLKWIIFPNELLTEKSDVEIPHPALEELPAFVGDHSRKLLSIAGSRVYVGFGDIIKEDIALMTGGLINHTGIIRRRGELHRCHQNSAKFWRKSPERYRLTTGYALDEDSWISHSWLQDPEDKIVETTIPFDLYYGVILDAEESEKFCKLVLKE